jgi:TDG/mug DNA glycosylase family protein
MASERAPILPDVLRPGLALVFCGTAPSRRSATEGAYYAHPGNYFWRTLHEIGLTPHRYVPAEFRSLAELGIGLTDLAKHHSGNDDQLPRDAFDVEALHGKLRRCAPRIVAFTSKHAARAVLARPIAAYGEQPEHFDDTRLFVLPSPSGHARGYWDIAPWRQLARQYRLIRGDE